MVRMAKSAGKIPDEALFSDLRESHAGSSPLAGASSVDTVVSELSFALPRCAFWASFFLTCPGALQDLFPVECLPTETSNASQ